MNGESREEYIQRTVEQVQKYGEVVVHGANSQDLSAQLEVANRVNGNCHYVKDEKWENSYKVTITEG